MAFLDNSGDILLDAVLTDTGRMRMARGTFNIVKFALGDDEINYGLFEANHVSGSAYQDLKILQTPVFEAFTNNTSVMKSKLMTIGRTNILYLPKLLLNTKAGFSPMVSGETAGTGNNDTFVLLANRDLGDHSRVKTSPSERPGYMRGDGEPKFPKNSIVIDQGIADSNEEQDITAAIDPDLRETQFIVKADHRLLRLLPGRPSIPGGRTVTDVGDPGDDVQTPVFIDDDQIAHYAFGSSNQSFVQRIIKPDGENSSEFAEELVHEGPLGNRLAFRLRASEAAKSSTSLYSKLGVLGSADTTADATVKTESGSDIGDCDFIDTIVRVTGVTTGYSIDIPVRVVRNTNPPA